MPGPQLYGKPGFDGKAPGRTCPAPTARSFQKLLNNFQPDRPGFFRVELAAEDAAVAGGGADLAPP